MKKKYRGFDLTSPVIAGGIGGSGTRVVAEILQASGVYLGSYLNGALDNVFFSRLICNFPELWTRPDLGPRFNTFVRFYFGQTVTPGDLVRLAKGARQPLHRWIWMHLRRSREGRTVHGDHTRWGWKNPRAQFYLPQLNMHFAECRYIHVIRHGLDMAFTSNTGQFDRWGVHFGIGPEDDRDRPVQLLDFWIAVNKWVLDVCQTKLPGRYHVLNFDNLCAQPEAEIAQLLYFLGVEPEIPVSELASLVQTPDSSGRYLQQVSIFSAQQVEAVRALGFQVD